MSRSLCWNDLSRYHINEITSAKTRQQRAAVIAGITSIQLPEGVKTSLEHVLLDFYCENVEICLENNLSAEKISTFFSIMNEVHLQSMDPNVTLVDSFGRFTKLIVNHSVHRPPFSIEIFTQFDVQLLSKYVHNTYYRHYKMYQYVFCPKQVANVESRIAGDLVEVPMICKPLSEGLPEEEYKIREQKNREEEEKQVEQERIAREHQQHQMAKSPTPVPTEPEEKSEEANTLDESLDESAGNEPQLPHPYIQRQLNQIKEMLSNMADSRFGEIEQRILQIEQALPDGGKDPKARSDSRKGGAATKPKK
jgi:hypothetical protein